MTNEEEEEGNGQASGAQKGGRLQKAKRQNLEDGSDDLDSDDELDFPENGDGSVSDHNEVHVPDISSVKIQDTS